MLGKIALVTGASSGIGLSTAELFCQKGLRVLTCDLNVSRLNHPNIIDSSFLDLTDEKALVEYMNMIERKFGGVDIIVNNAGRFDLLSIEETSLKIFQAQLDINLKAPFALIQHFLPSMRLKQFGRIINVASQKGLKGGSLQSAYCSSKHALIGLTKSVALEVAGTGVTCNSVCPGWVATPPLLKELQIMADKKGNSLQYQIKQFLHENQYPNTNIISPKDIAASIYFLTTETASEITGYSFSHDSGNGTD